MLFRRIATTLGMAGLIAVPAPAAQAAVPADQDAEYLRAVHQINLAEIESGRIAWLKTTDQKVKDLAATFMRDSIHLDADLYLTARDLRITLPAAPTAEQTALTQKYESAGQAGFDQLYLSTRLEARQEAIELTTARLGQGGDAKVKEFAQDAASVLAGHEKLLHSAD